MKRKYGSGSPVSRNPLSAQPPGSQGSNGKKIRVVKSKSPEREVPAERRDLAAYLCHVSCGQILLTAPHSLPVKRGGSIVKQRERTHLREHWVSTLCLMLVQEIQELEEERASKMRVPTPPSPLRDNKNSNSEYFN